MKQMNKNIEPQNIKLDNELQSYLGTNCPHLAMQIL
jgi:hypothetical protein